MDLVEALRAGAGPLSAIGWWALMLHAAWLLPDWLGKWQRLLDRRRRRARRKADRGREGRP